ncbi:uncharacterized protein G2W53_021819 [Senna tora]|uniref:Uncharacterized protein n=1 Tax=Senna tora TaxID=362788 RepID=A0A834TN21_9FABA|nr:uncharacterized protein G2W53_021819 [Senna tora]
MPFRERFGRPFVVVPFRERFGGPFAAMPFRERFSGLTTMLTVAVLHRRAAHSSRFGRLSLLEQV